jgi:hypothetical protein
MGLWVMDCSESWNARLPGLLPGEAAGFGRIFRKKTEKARFDSRIIALGEGSESFAATALAQ